MTGTVLPVFYTGNFCDPLASLGDGIMTDVVTAAELLGDPIVVKFRVFGFGFGWAEPNILSV